MTRQVEGAVLAAVGGAACSCALSGAALRFVRPGVRWELVCCGLLLFMLGAQALLRRPAVSTAGRHGSPGERSATPLDGPSDHDFDFDRHHDHGPGRHVGWLVLLPYLVVSLLVPPAAGAYAAFHDSGIVSAPSGRLVLPPLPPQPARDVTTLTLAEYSLRAVYGRGDTLHGRRVRLVGFASARVPGQPGRGWYLTRMAITCCAADATAVKVALVEPGHGQAPLADDSWVAVTGTWTGDTRTGDTRTGNRGNGYGGGLATLRADSIQPVAVPDDPYE